MEKLKGINSSKKAVYILLGLIWIFMLVLNLLTHYVADDYAYMISFSSQWWIEKVWDVFPSMAAHARIINGRLVSHGLGQLFMLWPKAVFDVVNASVFSGLMAAIYGVARGKGRHNALLLAGVFCAFWVFMPVFGQVALWQMGSVNYLWALLFGLLFLRPYIRRFTGWAEPPLWRRILLCVLALPFGMYTEITSFICAFLAAALLVLGRKKKSLRSWLWIPILAAAVGYILMMSMPAEMNAKSAKLDMETFLRNIDRCTSMLRTHGLWLLGAWAVAETLGALRKIGAERLSLSAVLAFGAVAANYMLTVATYYAERCFCTTATLLILAVAVLVPGLVEKGRGEVCAGAGAALAVVTALSIVTGVYDIWTTHTDWSLRETAIETAKAEGKTELTVPLICPSTKYSPSYGLADLTADPSGWPNDYMRAYYGIALRGE